MKITVPSDLTVLSVTDLQALVAELRTRGAELAGKGASMSADEFAEAEEISAAYDTVTEAVTTVEAAAAVHAEKVAALAAKFSNESADPKVEEPGEDPAEEKTETPDEEKAEDKDETGSAETVAAKGKTAVAALAGKTARPAAPSTVAKTPISIVASANTAFNAGDTLTMEQVTESVLDKVSSFSEPNGSGDGESLIHFPVAKFKMDFAENLTMKNADDMDTLTYAGDESRLEGKSLVAAGGWCAPSETLYDLCTTETLDGIASVPEVAVSRGGIKYTSGPDFSSIYTNTGFIQTEAQAIAGTAKGCYEIVCPAFTDVRLDAVGLCLKAPILTNAAYPELVKRMVSGSMIAHAHRVNASVLARMTTLAGAARVLTDFGTSMGSTLGDLELAADQLRQKYKMGLKATMEVKLPFWVKAVLRQDISLRNGIDPTNPITDMVMMAQFAARYLKVEFVYDWQEYSTTALGYPATFNALIYPAGTFVKGTSDVINLNTVYDAASLNVNVYTALFFEQGLLVARMCNEAVLVTIAVCSAGKSGIANIAQCGVAA